MSEPVKISLTTNAPQYRDALIDFMAHFRINARTALRYQGRLLGERLITFTPPRNKKQGEARVAKDIRKVVLGLDTLEEFDEAHAVLKGDTNIIRAFVNKSGVVYGVDKNLYRPHATLDEIAAHHQSYRRADGRVTDAGTETRDIGRWRFITKLVVPNDRLTEYISSVQSRVGRAKGGWASGTIELGGKVSKWIAFHARTAGRFINGTEESDPYFIWENKSEWAGGGDTGRVLSNAVASKIRDMRNQIAKSIKDGSKPIFR